MTQSRLVGSTPTCPNRWSHTFSETLGRCTRCNKAAPPRAREWSREYIEYSYGYESEVDGTLTHDLAQDYYESRRPSEDPPVDLDYLMSHE